MKSKHYLFISFEDEKSTVSDETSDKQKIAQKYHRTYIIARNFVPEQLKTFKIE